MVRVRKTSSQAGKTGSKKESQRTGANHIFLVTLVPFPVQAVKGPISTPAKKVCHLSQIDDWSAAPSKKSDTLFSSPELCSQQDDQQYVIGVTIRLTMSLWATPVLFIGKKDSNRWPYFNQNQLKKINVRKVLAVTDNGTGQKPPQF